MNSISRRMALKNVAVLGSFGLGASFAEERLPATTKILAGFPAGGSIDAVSRRIADAVRGLVAETVIVDNRPGAGGRIAIDILRNGPSDGSQWLVTPGSMLVIYPHVYRKLSYDPQRDLLPVAQVAQVPLALAVGPAVPASIGDANSYAAWVKGSSHRTNIGTPAAGNITHFLAFLLGRSMGIDFQYVPFRGSAPAVQDLLGGQIPAVINPLTELLPHAGSGKVRILGITARQRSYFVPQVPTLAEQGHPNVVGSEWMGLFAKPGTPAALVERMARSVRAAMKTAPVRDALEKLALEATGDSGGAQLARRIQDELAGWREVSRVFKFQLDE